MLLQVPFGLTESTEKSKMQSWLQRPQKKNLEEKRGEGWGIIDNANVCIYMYLFV